MLFGANSRFTPNCIPPHVKSALRDAIFREAFRQAFREAFRESFRQCRFHPPADPPPLLRDGRIME